MSLVGKRAASSAPGLILGLGADDERALRSQSYPHANDGRVVVADEDRRELQEQRKGGS